MRQTMTSEADNGRKKKEVSYPRRERVLLREALKRLGIKRHWENVRVWNPDYTNQIGAKIGGYQWIDFVFVHRGRLFCILYSQQWNGSGAKLFQKRWLEEKKQLLKDRGYPFIVVSRMKSSQEYQMLVYRMLHLS